MGNSEDLKLQTLALSWQLRNSAGQVAAIRDLTGRTFVGSKVSLSTLKLDALQVALSMALSSGSKEIAAAVVVGESPSQVSLENIREISEFCKIFFSSDDALMVEL